MFYSKEISIVDLVAITTSAGEMPVTCVILQNQKDSVVVMMTGVSLYISLLCWNLLLHSDRPKLLRVCASWSANGLNTLPAHLPCQFLIVMAET